MSEIRNGKEYLAFEKLSPEAKAKILYFNDIDMKASIDNLKIWVPVSTAAGGALTVLGALWLGKLEVKAAIIPYLLDWLR
jgi:hypothetical protein